MARTCTLLNNSQENGGVIIGSGKQYVIPVYQRPYSWTEEQLRKFTEDIFTCYRSGESHGISEPKFIGTMQVSAPDEHNIREIIDGQQRLTTFIILFRVLRQLYPGSTMAAEIPLDWLTTRVNNGSQQLYMSELVKPADFLTADTINPYLKNAVILRHIIQEKISDDDDAKPVFDPDNFIYFLTSRIYFVVIETRAGLSKTLQIFNAINTTGLDLGSGDVFKIRMYEYLKDKQGAAENAFDDISALYKKVDDNNRECGYEATDFKDILQIYQYILIAASDLPVVLYNLSSDNFYERLFDTVFNISRHEHFRNNTERIRLSVAEIDRVIDARYTWENYSYPTAEDAAASGLIGWSRYSRYKILVYVFLYKFGHEENCRTMLFSFLRQLSKLYIIYSIRCLKAISEIHTFSQGMVKDIIHKPYGEVMNALNNKIGNVELHTGGWYDLRKILHGDITYNAKAKNIICRLAALLDEDYKNPDQQIVDNIRLKLFDSPVDIEHIQAYNDLRPEDRQRIWDEWGDDINGIGNLVVLEEHINRSLKNNHYTDKRERYRESAYLSVGAIAENYDEWSYEHSKIRKAGETDKILRYLFEKTSDPGGV